MRITSKQLRQIIREELTREMQSRVPPQLGPAEDSDVSCGTCKFFCPKTQSCKAFGGYPVSADMVCAAWQGES
jgi:hypothetical protein